MRHSLLRQYLFFTDSYPFMVSVWEIRGNDHNCGGTLVTLLYILTAGHCVEETNAKDLYKVCNSSLCLVFNPF